MKYCIKSQPYGYYLILRGAIDHFTNGRRFVAAFSHRVSASVMGLFRGNYADDIGSVV